MNDILLRSEEEMAEQDRYGRRVKGRGGDYMDMETSERHAGITFEDLEQDGREGPARSVEGYIVFITGLHDEADEGSVLDFFGEFGQVKNVHLNIDRRTGYNKGYSLIEYETLQEAEMAVNKANGLEFMEKILTVSFAFSKQPVEVDWEPPERRRESGGRKRRDGRY